MRGGLGGATWVGASGAGGHALARIPVYCRRKSTPDAPQKRARRQSAWRAAPTLKKRRMPPTTPTSRPNPASSSISRASCAPLSGRPSASATSSRAASRSGKRRATSLIKSGFSVTRMTVLPWGRRARERGREGRGAHQLMGKRRATSFKKSGFSVTRMTVLPWGLAAVVCARGKRGSVS